MILVFIKMQTRFWLMEGYNYDSVPYLYFLAELLRGLRLLKCGRSTTMRALTCSISFNSAGGEILRRGYRIPSKKQVVDAFKFAEKFWWCFETKASVASGVFGEELGPLISNFSCDFSKSEMRLGIRMKRRLSRSSIR